LGRDEREAELIINTLVISSIVLLLLPFSDSRNDELFLLLLLKNNPLDDENDFLVFFPDPSESFPLDAPPSIASENDLPLPNNPTELDASDGRIFRISFTTQKPPRPRTLPRESSVQAGKS
jgi:hypothetical protein